MNYSRCLDVISRVTSPPLEIISVPLTVILQFLYAQFCSWIYTLTHLVSSFQCSTTAVEYKAPRSHQGFPLGCVVPVGGKGFGGAQWINRVIKWEEIHWDSTQRTDEWTHTAFRGIIQYIRIQQQRLAGRTTVQWAALKRGLSWANRGEAELSQLFLPPEAVCVCVFLCVCVR